VGGAWHAGVLAALAEAGWDARRAEIVVGTSAGSVMGAYLRAGVPPTDLLAWVSSRQLSTEGAAIMARAPRYRPTPRPDRANVGSAQPRILLQAVLRPWAVRPGTVAAGMLPPGTVPNHYVVDAVEGVLGQWPEDPLWVCAVRLSDGRRIVFGRRDAPAVRPSAAVGASCAIPGWYTPMEIGSERYVDGGVHSPTNADLVAGQGLDLVVVSSPLSAAGNRPSLAVGAAARRWSRAHLDAEAMLIRRGGTPVVALQPTAEDQEVMGPDPMDHTRRPAVAAQARRSTRARLDRSDPHRLFARLLDHG
jgi:NTE family protein